MGAPAEVECTGQDRSAVAQGTDFGQKSEAHQGQAVAPDHGPAGACGLPFTLSPAISKAR